MTQRALQRRTVAEDLADRLSSRILRGSLRPGTPLREERIASTYETTRTTVRDALRLLEQDGLVSHETHRGARVTVLEQADLNDIIDMRLAIEPQVVRRAVERAVDLSRLYAVADLLESTARAGDWPGYGAADIRFHTELVGMAGSERLLEFFGTTLRLLKLTMLAGDQAADAGPDLPAHVFEHRRLLELIEARRAGEAARLMTRHLESARRHVR